MSDPSNPDVVPPEAVIDRLAHRVGQLTAQLVVREVALEQTRARVRYLEGEARRREQQQQAPAAGSAPPAPSAEATAGEPS